MLLEGTGKCTTEVEGESFAFDEIRELAESMNAGPGEAFIITLDLRESLGEITVEHDSIEFGSLEITDAEKAAWGTILEDSGDLEVTARIWTSRDWEDDFYASVRVDLPSIEDAEAQIAEDHRRYLTETYGTENPTPAQVNRRADEQLALSKNPETARKARERLAQMGDPHQVPAAQRDSVPAATMLDWSALLVPDETPRANFFQRGYTRGTAGKAMGDVKAPRIDYATVGQCKAIVSACGGDIAEVDNRGSALLKTLWWVLVFLLGIVALVGLVTPPAGWVVTALVAWPFVHHYTTRRKLDPPFGPQH